MGLDPRKSLTQYTRTSWTQEHGLPQDTIRAITQTPDGYLWLGTDEGLARFDGYEFAVFNKTRCDLPANSITALAAAEDGTLWIGTANGLTRYQEGGFRTYTVKDGLPDNAVTEPVRGSCRHALDCGGRVSQPVRGRQVHQLRARRRTSRHVGARYPRGQSSRSLGSRLYGGGETGQRPFRPGDGHRMH